MEDPVVVEVMHARDELVKESFCFGGKERLGHILKEGFQVVFEEVEDEEDTIQVQSVRRSHRQLNTEGNQIAHLLLNLTHIFTNHYLPQSYNIDMLTIHQRLYLPQPRNRYAIQRILHLQPLERNDLPRNTVLCS